MVSRCIHLSVADKNNTDCESSNDTVPKNQRQDTQNRQTKTVQCSHVSLLLALRKLSLQPHGCTNWLPRQAKQDDPLFHIVSLVLVAFCDLLSVRMHSECFRQPYFWVQLPLPIPGSTTPRGPVALLVLPAVHRHGPKSSSQRQRVARCCPLGHAPKVWGRPFGDSYLNPRS